MGQVAALLTNLDTAITNRTERNDRVKSSMTQVIDDRDRKYCGGRSIGAVQVLLGAAQVSLGVVQVLLHAVQVLLKAVQILLCEYYCPSITGTIQILLCGPSITG